MSNRYLIKKIKSLKNLEVGGRPQDCWVASNKEILMNQLQPMAQSAKSDNNSYYFKFIGDFMGQRVFRPVLGAMVVIVCYFFGISFFTVANASLPGDMLYPIKTTSEKVQIALTFDETNKAKLQIGFVSRRGDELHQIAIKDENPEIKKGKVSEAVKRLSSDVKSVNEKLNSVKAQSNNKNTLDLAKEIDDKTLKIEKDIVNANAALSDDAKKDVAIDMKEAISSTEDVGTKALQVIVDKSATGQEISDNGVANRVSERIKSTETSLAQAVDEVNKAVSSTLPVISAITGLASTDTLPIISTTTLQEIAEKPKLAQDAISQAKDLLEKNDFNSALDKIQETKVLVGQVMDKTPALTEIVDMITIKIDNINSSTAVTATPAVIPPK